MAKKEGERARTIRMADEVWAALDADAARCMRSSSGQLEALLRAYYGIGAVELRGVEEVRQQVSQPIRQARAEEHIQVPIIDGPRAPDNPLRPGEALPEPTQPEGARKRR